MGESILFVDGDRIGMAGESGVKLYASDYLSRYRQNIKSIKERNAWKNEGSGAAFRMERNPLEQEEAIRTAVNGVSCIGGTDRIVYSISSNDYSGVFVKSISENPDPEWHVVHNAKLDFGSLDYNPVRKQLAVSVRAGDADKHIALLDMESGACKTLTEGDSVDENPRWGIANRDVIYYNSCGIGRDSAGNYSGLGPSAVMRMDLKAREVTELMASEKFDYILPVEDAQGNLYFIRRPYAGAHNRTMTFVDVLLIPFKILRGFFKFLEFFTLRYTGETFSSRGVNPAKSREPNARDVFINGNLINAEKALKENTAKGERFPGIAPASWQLMRLSGGTVEAVKKGVLDYDIAVCGDIVYSNGRFIIRLARRGDEEKIEKHDMALKLRVMD